MTGQQTGSRAPYRAVVHAEHEGGYWAEVPELPGCFTQRDTLDEIYSNLLEAIASHADSDPTTACSPMTSRR